MGVKRHNTENPEETYLDLYTKPMRRDIILSTINAKWIHPSLALRLLKANLGPLEERCEIIEFTLRQPLDEKVSAIMAAAPCVVGFSVSIWNHTATIELLEALETKWAAGTAAASTDYAPAAGHETTAEKNPRPVIVLGGPEVSWLPPDAAIFRYANFIIRGEAEHEFRKICDQVLSGREARHDDHSLQRVDVNSIKTAYHLYTAADLGGKLIYVESSRGCPFNCEFCLSSVKTESVAENAGTQNTAARQQVRFFPLEQFLAEMNILIERGVRTIKFLDRTFNLDIKRAIQILEFFLDKIDERKKVSPIPFVVHFEMVPSRFPMELCETLSRFPPGTLRLEIGIQTLNAEVSAHIGRPSEPERELETLRFLREKTGAIIHADLIAGLPGEDFASFASGFDRLWAALFSQPQAAHPRNEIQLGILKLLPGAPLARLSTAFGMRYNSSPPYEITETAVMSAHDLNRIKNFARFWELIVNRGLLNCDETPVFAKFMALSDSLLARFGRNWGIDKSELRQELGKII